MGGSKLPSGQDKYVEFTTHERFPHLFKQSLRNEEALQRGSRKAGGGYEKFNGGSGWSGVVTI